MAYDFFTNIPEPTIPISLFADAARAGAQVGNAIPTQLTSAIRGGIEGIQDGQKIRSNEQTIEANEQLNAIRANQVEQLPLQNARDQAALEREQSMARIAQMKEQNALKLDKIQVELEEKKIREESARIDRESDIYATKDRIAETVAGPNARQVLSDPKMVQVMFSDSKYAMSVLGALSASKQFSQEEMKGLYQRADFARAQELKSQEEQARIKYQHESFKELDEVSKKLNASPDIKNALSAMGIDNPQDLLRRNVEVVRTNQKTYLPDPVTGQPGNIVDTSVPDKYTQNSIEANSAQSYELIVDGRRSPHPIGTKAEAALLNSYIDISRQRYDIKRKEAQQIQQDAAGPQQVSASAPAQAPSPMRSMGDINAGLQKSGLIDPAQAAPILEKARLEGLEPKNMVMRAIDNIIPNGLLGNFIDEAIVPNAYETDDATSARQIVKETAPMLADKTMEILKSGTTEQRQTIRLWAKTNEIELNKKSLTRRYEEDIRKELSDAYDAAEQVGLEERAAILRQQQAEDAASELGKGIKPGDFLNKGAAPAKEPMAGMRADALGQGGQGGQGVPDFFMDMSVGNQGANMIENLDAKVASLTSKYNLDKLTVGKLKAAAKNIESTELLANLDPHVKAIIAVESLGKPKAVSPTNVVGYMQVTRDVARMYNKDRTIPKENIEAGTMYINRLIRSYNGNKMLAYAAYNAGPGTINKAIKLSGGSSDWSVVKQFLMPALVHYAKSEKWDPQDKFRESVNYPERVALNEELFQGSTPGQMA